MGYRLPILLGFVLLIGTFIAPHNAFATVFSCSADMLGANEVPPSGSLGTGTLTGTFDTNTNQLSWNISWSGLASPETGMHFHGAATPIQNAAVQVNIGAISGLVSPSIGNTVINAADEADLLAGLWYINLHTQNNPPGAIRGQVACDQVVGGELLQIDSTALMLAGLQTSAIWMLPVLAGAAGAGAFYIKTKMNKK